MKSLFSLKLARYSNSLLHTWIILFSLYGTLMVLSASMNSASTIESLMGVAIRQLLFLGLGSLIMIKISQWMNFKLLKKWVFILSIIMIVFLCLPLLFAPVGGAQAWIRFPGGLSLQPSEFAKVLVVLLFALYGGDVQRKDISFWTVLKWPILFTMIFVFIVLVFQSDLGSAVILFALGWMSMMMLSGPTMKWVKLWMFVFTLLGLALIVYLLTPGGIAFLSSLPIPRYMLNRFIDMLNPVERRYDSSYQLFNSLIAFSKGELWGIGLGQSIQKLGYLPVATSDYILAVIVEETGIVGFLIVFVSYVSMMIMLLIHALKIKYEKYKLILFGNVMFLMLHFILNVGGVSAAIPLTGVPLLMISAGGSSQLAIMMMFGFSQAAIHQDALERRKTSHENHLRQSKILKTSDTLLDNHAA